MERLVGTNTLAVIHFNDCSEDPGVIALLEKANGLLRDAQKKSFQQQLPPGFEWASGLSTISQRGLKASQLPEAVVVVELGTNTNLVYMGAFGLDVMPRFILVPFRFMINQTKGSGASTSYRNEVIANVGDVFVMLIGSSAIVASDSNAMMRTVDRVLGDVHEESLYDSAPPSLAERWDIYGLCRNDEDLLKRLFGDIWKDHVSDVSVSNEGIVRMFPTELIRQAWFGVDIVSAQQIRGEITVVCIDEASAALCLERATSILENLLSEVDDEMMDVSLETERKNSRMTVQIDVIGISAIIEHVIDSSMDIEQDTLKSEDGDSL